MPNAFEIDVTDMQPGDVIRLADVPMPKGVTPLGDPEMPIVTILITSAAEAAADGAEAGAAEGTEAGEAGDTPAAE